MCLMCGSLVCIFFFKQKTAYEMRISDWSSDVCSSDPRCEFLRAVAEDLDLHHVEVVEARLEAVETRSAATISARAFAPLDKLIDLSARFSTESTRWLLPKGRNAVKELALLPRPWQSLFHVEQSRPDAESRILVGAGRLGRRRAG